MLLGMLLNVVCRKVYKNIKQRSPTGFTTIPLYSLCSNWGEITPLLLIEERFLNGYILNSTLPFDFCVSFSHFVSSCFNFVELLKNKHITGWLIDWLIDLASVSQNSQNHFSPVKNYFKRTKFISRNVIFKTFQMWKFEKFTRSRSMLA